MSFCLTSSSTANNYEEIGFIGEGTYGTVFKARDLVNEGQSVAIKKVNVALYEDGVPPTLIREISLLKQLEMYEHPNVVRLLDICYAKRLEKEKQLILYLVFEYIEQDLGKYLSHCPSPGLGPDRIKDIMYQILNGVDFLHSNRIVHRDLKPQNILITNSGRVKLADFGLARIYEDSRALTSVVVTLWYRAPEVLLGASYASWVDIWSCGCIFAELHRRKAFLNGQSEPDQLSKIFSVIGSPSESEWPEEAYFPCNSYAGFKAIPLNTLLPEMPPEACELLKAMLRFNPRLRITAKEALNHVYFDEYVLHPPIYEYEIEQKIKDK
ncbi:cyclin-dependent kinase 4-like [Panonychus citri]|uniref:cyclin-dependent kinase 4-like n=1 Tax=Panonychus citri TaxID=50023 RepID=UPI0023080E2A|nr:cyclin-dependent kinase 4-like [Panonychus citri]